MMMLYALVAVCALSGVLCDESTELDCSKIKTQENFNFSQLVGRWHLAQASETCFKINNRSRLASVTVDFQLDEDKSKKLIFFSTFESLTDSGPTNITVPMVVLDESTNPAKMNLTVNFFGTINSLPLYIVGTDYETYIIVSRCFNTYEVASIFVKNKGLVGETVSRASTVAKEQGLNHTFSPLACP